MRGINLEYGYSTNTVEKIKLIHEVGFDSILLNYDENIHKNVKQAHALGLSIDALHLPYKGMVNTIWQNKEFSDQYKNLLSKCIEFASINGIEDVVMHITSTNSPPPINNNGRIFIDELLNICEKYTINLCLENLRRLDYLQFLYENCPSKYLAFCYDSGHANAFTHNLLTFPWEKFAIKLRCVHLHDNNGIDDQHLLPFDGNIQWEYVGNELIQYCKTKKISLELHKEASENYSCSELAFLNICYERMEAFYKLMKE
jgi:sugar phosphate isomerase/epimerase